MYSDPFVKEIVINHYDNTPAGAEYNNRGQRTHLWRKLSCTGKRITILMNTPSTATSDTNDHIVTCLMGRLKEVTDYSSMSLINVADGCDWIENLNMLIRLFDTDVLIAWGSDFIKKCNVKKI